MRPHLPHFASTPCDPVDVAAELAIIDRCQAEAAAVKAKLAEDVKGFIQHLRAPGALTDAELVRSVVGSVLKATEAMDEAMANSHLATTLVALADVFEEPRPRPFYSAWIERQAAEDVAMMAGGVEIVQMG